MEYKTDLLGGTVVTFAGGGISEQSKIVFVARQNEHWIVATDKSPFHPLSLSWPDQPGDRGWLTTSDGIRLNVCDSCEGILDCTTGDLFTGEGGLTQRRAIPDMRSVVIHVVDSEVSLAAQVGRAVTLEVDASYRSALSLQHTGVHLAALALNQCAASFWAKDFADQDTRGSPNFDKAAVTKSTITQEGSTDVYRIGKTLRKKGFDRDAFLSNLPRRSLTINDIVRQVLAVPVPVTVAPTEGYLDDRRVWSTILNGATVSMPCGGTHISDLSQIAEINVVVMPFEDGFIMVTRCLGL